MEPPKSRIIELLEAAYKLEPEDPTDPLPDGARVLGIMPDWIKPIRMMFLMIAAELEERGAEYQACSSERRRAELVGEISVLLGDLADVDGTLSNNLSRHFGEYHPDGYGVAAGWRVWVSVSPNTGPKPWYLCKC